MLSQTHSGCSEAFYKTELETQIKTEPTKTMEERRKMMEVLKRFEEESADDTAALEAEAEGDDLADRLETLDLGASVHILPFPVCHLMTTSIDHAGYEELWDALTPAERDKFMKALGDPGSDLAQQLLSSEELEKDVIEPWWERDADPGPSDERTAPRRVYRRGRRPAPVDVPPTMIKASSGSGPSLLYNVCAVL